MITIHTYFAQVDQIKVSQLPKNLKEGFDYVKELTENHKTWKYYKEDAEIKEVVDSYFASLDIFLNQKLIKQHPELNKGKEKEAREAAIDLIEYYVKRGDSLESLRKGALGSHSDEYSASISGNKIYVKELNN